MEPDTDAPDWMIARHAIKLYLNDKCDESMDLLKDRTKSIYVTSGICFITFFDAAITFDSDKMTEAVDALKKIEECHKESSWLQSIKSKLFVSSKQNINLETSIYEQIVIADSLIFQSLLNFLQTDITSCLKGGWMLRRAWKIYQDAYERLIAISKKLINEKNVMDTSVLPTKSMIQDLKVEINNEHLEDYKFSPESSNNNKRFYAFPNKTVSNFVYFGKSSVSGECSASAIKQCSSASKHLRNSSSNPLTYEDSEDELVNGSTSISSLNKTVISEKNCKVHRWSENVNYNMRHINGDVNQNNMHRSNSLFASLHSLGSSIIESTSSLFGFTKLEEDDAPSQLNLSMLSRLLSAVCFGYGTLRLIISLVPSRYLRWTNILGFKGDRNIALKCLSFSRTGDDMRAPLSSLALLWYHTVVRPFFALDGTAVGSGVKDAAKILDENYEEFGNSSIFLFFKGRMERLKPDVSAAIDAYNLSLARTARNEMKILGLHEVGWCRLSRLEWIEASSNFAELSQTSRWSRGFYSYMANICQGAGNGQTPNAREILDLLDEKVHKHQIEKYIRRRVQRFPSATFTPRWAKHLPHRTPWALYCFELLYLWNTLPSCSVPDLQKIISICTPDKGCKTLQNEPMVGLALLIRGACLLSLSDLLKEQACSSSASSSSTETRTTSVASDIDKCANDAMESFKSCIELQLEIPSTEINQEYPGESTDDVRDVHISAFAKYELGMMLLKNSKTRNEGKMMLLNISNEYKDYDFENRLNVRITATLKSVERFEAKKRKDSLEVSST